MWSPPAIVIEKSFSVTAMVFQAGAGVDVAVWVLPPPFPALTLWVDEAGEEDELPHAARARVRAAAAAARRRLLM